MSHNVPPTGGHCTVPWCESDHANGPGLHFQMVADIEADRQGVEIRYQQQEEENGRLGRPFLRLLYGPAWRQADTLDIPIPAAVALAGVLALLTSTGLADLVDALAHAARGPHTLNRTTWQLPASDHAGDLGEWQILGGTVHATTGQASPYPPAIRLTIARDDGRERILDLDPGQAHAVGDVLDMFDLSDSGQIGEALFRAAEQLGEA
ncbi:hypothetical protein HTZ77_18530 [Nonomuraea sp. SMC257]|uniref:Uncharacterized protein n=1 Tax=Nonomuraea montanisoli TaxID=2741721 RepID=A0A7Y6I8L2_9ACTN|nr:hypothetical protein [Nonomuraea montanisoli]NUW33411.1 hypothetical protein [Nonomuraea montanisoli]